MKTLKDVLDVVLKFTLYIVLKGVLGWAVKGLFCDCDTNLYFVLIIIIIIMDYSKTRVCTFADLLRTSF
jgi:hypothetical protein